MNKNTDYPSALILPIVCGLILICLYFPPLPHSQLWAALSILTSKPMLALVLGELSATFLRLWDTYTTFKTLVVIFFNHNKPEIFAVISESNLLNFLKGTRENMINVLKLFLV